MRQRPIRPCLGRPWPVVLLIAACLLHTARARQTTVTTVTEMLNALNDESVNVIVADGQYFNLTDETFPFHGVTLRGRTVFLEGATRPDGSLVYFEGDKLHSRVLVTDGAQFFQRNFWVDDCFGPAFPYTCFAVPGGGGARIEFRDGIFSDATCVHWSESSGITNLMNAARFARPLSVKTHEISDRELHVNDTGWIPYIVSTAQWRFANVTVSCTGNITHELPAGYVVMMRGWSAQERLAVVTLIVALLGALYWVSLRRRFSPPLEVLIASKKGFDVLEQMGAGRFGKVYRAIYRQSGQEVAVKVMPIRFHGWSELRAVWRECQVMRRLRHPSCIRIITYYSARVVRKGKNPASSRGLNVAAGQVSPSLTPDRGSSLGSSGWTVHDVTEALDQLAAWSLDADQMREAAEEVVMGGSTFGPAFAPSFGRSGSSASTMTGLRRRRGYASSSSGGLLNGSGSADPSSESDADGTGTAGGSSEVPGADEIPIDNLMLQVHLVTEIADRGTLRDYVENGYYGPRGGPPRKMAALLDTALDIAEGLAAMHSPNHRLVHRDLSPNNVLLISEFNERGYRAVISDFGLATVVSLGATHHTSDAKGTVSYMPPELFSDNIVSPAVDIYSFGVLLLFMMAGQEPYGSLTYGRIVSHKMAFSDEQLLVPEALKASTDPMVVTLMELARLCTQWDRKTRPSADEVIEALRRLATSSRSSKNTPPASET